MYTYALLPAIDSIPEIVGLEEQPLAYVNGGGVIAAVQPGVDVSQYQEESAVLQAVLTHDRVIQELFQHTDVLPLRFGTVFASLALLESHLQQEQSVYQQRLSRLQGLAEFTLRWEALAPPIPALPAAKGRAYFQAKKEIYEAEQARQQASIEERSAILSALFSAFPPAAPTQEQGERLHLLWPRALGQPIRDWLKAHPLTYWQTTLIGPLPPYHFV